MTHEQLSASISKTGFVLENRIAQELKAAKWTVISNRFYVDDAEESIREIDLVAYKATRVQHFDVYTTLIISCKKNQDNAWALLSRGIDLKDPNSDWQPLHAWTNEKALSYQLEGSSKRYHDYVMKRGTGGALQNPDVEVFAFQEMIKSSGAPKNDRSIFQAITSLMKAQAYEMGALPQRKKNPAIYQFNLLSIVDADLVRLMFDGATVTSRQIEGEHYIARYIIKKRETFSRIRFIHADSFSNLLPEYGALHTANCTWFGDECDAFFKDVLKDSKRAAVFLDDFRKAVSWEIRWPFIQAGIKAPEKEHITIEWQSNKALPKICGLFTADEVRLLNADRSANAAVKKALDKIYRFRGAFEFAEDDIPF